MTRKAPKPVPLILVKVGPLARAELIRQRRRPWQADGGDDQRRLHSALFTHAWNLAGYEDRQMPGWGQYVTEPVGGETGMLSFSTPLRVARFISLNPEDSDPVLMEALTKAEAICEAARIRIFGLDRRPSDQSPQTDIAA